MLKGAEGTTGLRDNRTTDLGAKAETPKAEMLVRSEKTCVSEGESPSSSEAKLPEFEARVTNGKV
jgi:hypothetical protein